MSLSVFTGPVHSCREALFLRFVFFRGNAVCIFQNAGDEAAGKFALSAAFDIEIAHQGKHCGADEIDEQILHGVQKADVKIAAHAQGRCVPSLWTMITSRMPSISWG